jgi:tol-pal system protein YbgF
MFRVMFRHSILPHARPVLTLGATFGATLGVVLLAVPVPSLGQSFFGSDRSTSERLDRIERDLNMLQRQVYRGAPGPTVGGDSGAAVNVELRMNRIEEQMRDLTGRIEEYTNQLERLRQRVEQINSDLDVRLGQSPSGPGGPGGPGPTALAGPPPPGPGGLGGRSRQAPDMSSTAGLGPPNAPASAMPRGALAAPPSYGTLTPPGTPPGAPPPTSPDVASAGEGLGAGPGRLLPSGSATEQYNQAFGLVKQADYPAAEAALRSFVEQHPNDPMAGNAQYWLGETLYARSKFIEAASAFAEGYRRYPRNVKAPDALLKLGMSLGHANQKQNACVALSQFDHDFPHAAANIKQQAAAEKKRLGC